MNDWQPLPLYCVLIIKKDTEYLLSIVSAFCVTLLHYLPDGEEDVPEEVDGDGRRQGEGGAVQTLAGVTGGNKTLISILCIKQDYMYIFITWTWWAWWRWSVPGDCWTWIEISVSFYRHRMDPGRLTWCWRSQRGREPAWRPCCFPTNSSAPPCSAGRAPAQPGTKYFREQKYFKYIFKYYTGV